MRNRTHVFDILKLFLGYGASVTEACMTSAVGLEVIDVDVMILLEHGGNWTFRPPVSGLRREIDLFKFLLEHRGELTKNLMEALAANEQPSIEYLKLLLGHLANLS